MPSMTYYEAALSVLRSARRPLSTQEITDLVLQRKLIVPGGKTPSATMSAALYNRVGNNSELVKLDAPGNGRAKRGSVRWTVRKARKSGATRTGSPAVPSPQSPGAAPLG
jgi:hypothetical protein